MTDAPLFSPVPMTPQLIEDLQRHASTRPAALAARTVGESGSQSLSYSDIQAHVSQLAALLRQTVAEGATVMLCVPNRPSFIATFLGILAAGNAVFPLAEDSAGAELAAAGMRAGAAAAIVGPQAARHLRMLFACTQPVSEIGDPLELLTAPTWDMAAPRGAALLLQSSGTTDRPKIALRERASLDAVCQSMVKACRFTPDDHVLAAVPLCHSYGLEHGLLAPIAAGSCVHVCEKFDLPAVLGELREGGITILPGVPFMFDMLSRAGDAVFPTLRRAYSAGGPLPATTFDAFRNLSGLRIGQVYGATEIGSVTFNDPDSSEFDPRSVGMPMDGVDIRILDVSEPNVDAPLPPGAEGQVAISAASMMSRYVDGENASLVGKHYLTGDLGALSTNGSLKITGRLKLFIDVGGRKVNPAEVEAVLRQHPNVGSCVVVPLQLSESVCRVKAVVTSRDPGVVLSTQELRAFARARLSAYKVPRVIELRDALPMSPAGKVLRTRMGTS